MLFILYAFSFNIEFFIPFQVLFYHWHYLICTFLNLFQYIVQIFLELFKYVPLRNHVVLFFDPLFS